MKFLCICDGGNVRSHAMAVSMKEMGHEAVPAGRWNVSGPTMVLLCEWADTVIIMEAHMKESIPAPFHNKIHVVDVGPDVYGVGINPDLRSKVNEGRHYLLGRINAI